MSAAHGTREFAIELGIGYVVGEQIGISKSRDFACFGVFLSGTWGHQR